MHTPSVQEEMKPSVNFLFLPFEREPPQAARAPPIAREARAALNVRREVCMVFLSCVPVTTARESAPRRRPRGRRRNGGIQDRRPIPLMRESRDPFSLGAPSADVTRSRKIARKTIDRPASVPLAILIFASAETTS